jgi:hypothetical protein
MALSSSGEGSRRGLILALEDRCLVGCAFAGLREDCVYVGKLAVDAAAGAGAWLAGSCRRRGVARAHGRRFVELEARIELTENHATFAALGFSKVAESAHPGFDRPTSITMRKPVPANRWQGWSLTELNGSVI